MKRTFMQKIADAWLVLTTPSCWLQNHSYSKSWDALLNHLMEHCKFQQDSAHVASIGRFTVWISNHPYASFTERSSSFGRRPSRATILRAMEKFEQDIYQIPTVKQP